MIKYRQYISIFLAICIYASSAGLAGQRGTDIKFLDDGSPSYREGGHQSLSGILEKDVTAKTFSNTGIKDQFPGQNLTTNGGNFILQTIKKITDCCRVKSLFQLIHFLLCVHFFQFHSFW